MATKARAAKPAPKREPSKEVWPLLEMFSNMISEHGEERAPELLEEFLQHVERNAAERSERMLKQAALNDRIRATAARRK